MSDKHDLIAVPEQSEKQDELKPHDPHEINPKISSDIAYWSHQFHVSGQILHEAIRMHGTSVEKIRIALAKHEVNLT